MQERVPGYANTEKRLEKLLNSFGGTLQDLPIIYDYDKPSYQMNAQQAMYQWLEERGGINYIKDWDKSPEYNYICHLADVIDKLETALMTARRMISCRDCIEVGAEECYGTCEDRFRISDYALTGLSPQEYEQATQE